MIVFIVVERELYRRDWSRLIPGRVGARSGVDCGGARPRTDRMGSFDSRDGVEVFASAVVVVRGSEDMRTLALLSLSSSKPKQHVFLAGKFSCGRDSQEACPFYQASSGVLWRRSGEEAAGDVSKLRT
jgi:hypothetical protein